MIEISDLRGRLPKFWIAEAADRYGEPLIAGWCADLLVERIAYDDPAFPSLGWLGGEPALNELRRGELTRRGADHWPRVWAARGLLYVWIPEAAGPVCQSLADPAWRVRELASKVVRRRELGEAAELLPELAADSVPRVRAAAARALGHVAEAEAAEAIRPLLHDDDPVVCREAQVALAELARRLDRPL